MLTETQSARGSRRKPSTTNMKIENIPEGISLKIMSEEVFQAQLSHRRTEKFFFISHSKFSPEKVNLNKLSNKLPRP